MCGTRRIRLPEAVLHALLRKSGRHGPISKGGQGPSGKDVTRLLAKILLVFVRAIFADHCNFGGSGPEQILVGKLG